MAYKALTAVALGAALAPLDTAVNIAFPAITDAFAMPVPAIQWLVVCYVLTYASLLLNCGRWADISGHRKVFLLGLAWSIAALVLCALAPTYGWLLFFRILQGIGAALVLAASPALATLAFPVKARGKAVAVYGFCFAAAFALGPLIGGFLVQYWGWTSVFWFRVPLAAVALLLGVLLIPEAAENHAYEQQHFDVLGGISLSGMIVCFLLAVNRAGAGNSLSLTLAVAVLAILLGILFVRHELRCPQPIVDLTLFRYSLFGAANLANVLNQLAAFTVLLLCPYYLVRVLQADIAQAGVILSLSPLAMMLASALTARLSRRLSALAVCQFGSVLLLCGLFGIGLWSAQPDFVFIALALVTHGFGLGLFQVANMDFVMGVLPRDAQGVAGSLVMLMRTIGVVIGAGAGAMLFAFLYQSSPLDHHADNNFIDAFRLTFRVAAGVSGLAWLLMLMASAKRQRP